MSRSTRLQLARCLDGTTEAGWLLLLVAVPLYFNPRTQTVFEPDKSFLLLHVVLAMLASTGLGTWLRHGGSALAESAAALGRAGRHPLAQAAAAWLLLQVLSTTLSIDPEASLLGSHTHRSGLLVSAAGVAMFLMLAGRLRTPAQRRRVRGAFVLSGTCVAAYALAQRLGMEPVAFASDFGRRSFSTLGNPIFTGAYLVTGLMAALGEVASRRRKGEAGWGPALLAVVQATGLLLTASRGPVLGLLVGVAVTGLVAAIATVDPARRRRLAVLLLVACVAGVVAVAAGALLDDGGPAALGRLGRLVDADTGSARLRLEAWRSVSDLMLLPDDARRTLVGDDDLGSIRFVVGYGPETLPRLAPAVTTEELARLGGPGRAMHRSHNELLDRLVEGGSLGLAAYLLLWQVALLACLGNPGDARLRAGRYAGFQLIGVAASLGLVVATGSLHLLGAALAAGVVAGLIALVVIRPASVRRPPARLWILAALVAHLTQLQFSFEVLPTWTAFWILAGLLVADDIGDSDREPEPRVARAADADPHGWLLGAALSVLAVTFLGAVPGTGGFAEIIGRSLGGDAAAGLSGAWPIPLAAVVAAILLSAAGVRASRVVGLGLALGVAVGLLHVGGLAGAAARADVGSVAYAEALIGSWRLDVAALSLLLAGGGLLVRRLGTSSVQRGHHPILTGLLLLSLLAGVTALSLRLPPGRCVAADIPHALSLGDVAAGRPDAARAVAALAADLCPEIGRYAAVHRQLAETAGSLPGDERPPR